MNYEINDPRLNKEILEHATVHSLEPSEMVERCCRSALLPFTVKGYTRMPWGVQQALQGEGVEQSTTKETT